jgi:hypothetical protein
LFTVLAALGIASPSANAQESPQVKTIEVGPGSIDFKNIDLGNLKIFKQGFEEKEKSVITQESVTNLSVNLKSNDRYVQKKAFDELGDNFEGYADIMGKDRIFVLLKGFLFDPQSDVRDPAWRLVTRHGFLSKPYFSRQDVDDLVQAARGVKKTNLTSKQIWQVLEYLLPGMNNICDDQEYIRHVLLPMIIDVLKTKEGISSEKDIIQFLTVLYSTADSYKYTIFDENRKLAMKVIFEGDLNWDQKYILAHILKTTDISGHLDPRLEFFNTLPRHSELWTSHRLQSWLDIYSNEKFLGVTVGLGPANRLAVAFGVDNLLGKYKLSSDSKNIDAIVQFIMRVRQQHALLDVMNKDTKLVLIAAENATPQQLEQVRHLSLFLPIYSPELLFNDWDTYTNRVIQLAHSAGISDDHIQIFRGSQGKGPALKAFSQLGSDGLMFIGGHGDQSDNKNGVYLSNLTEGAHINPDELVNARKLNPANGIPWVVDDQCYSGKCVSGVFDEMQKYGVGLNLVGSSGIRPGVAYSLLDELSKGHTIGSPIKVEDLDNLEGKLNNDNDIIPDSVLILVEI